MPKEYRNPNAKEIEMAADSVVSDFNHSGFIRHAGFVILPHLRMHWDHDLWTTRQRLGLRQSCGAFGWLACIAKAPEDWRTPKPGGSSSDCGQRASVLECGGPPPLSMGVCSRNSCGSWKASRHLGPLSRPHPRPFEKAPPTSHSLPQSFAQKSMTNTSSSTGPTSFPNSLWAG